MVLCILLPLRSHPAHDSKKLELREKSKVKCSYLLNIECSCFPRVLGCSSDKYCFLVKAREDTMIQEAPLGNTDNWMFDAWSQSHLPNFIGDDIGLFKWEDIFPYKPARHKGTVTYRLNKSFHCWSCLRSLQMAGTWGQVCGQSSSTLSGSCLCREPDQLVGLSVHGPAQAPTRSGVCAWLRGEANILPRGITDS